jgi:hypothetical protein
VLAPSESEARQPEHEEDGGDDPQKMSHEPETHKDHGYQQE